MNSWQCIPALEVFAQLMPMKEILWIWGANYGISSAENTWKMHILQLIMFHARNSLILQPEQIAWSLVRPKFLWIHGFKSHLCYTYVILDILDMKVYPSKLANICRNRLCWNASTKNYPLKMLVLMGLVLENTPVYRSIFLPTGRKK